LFYYSLPSNPFELVVVAALRTKQLMAGCVPRVTPAHKLTSTATLEVLAGKVAACVEGRPTDNRELPGR
jgi:DNA-directed RNA polymerase subunit K/omega